MRITTDTDDNKPPATIEECKKNLCHCLPNKCICKRDPKKAKKGALADKSGWGTIPVTERCYEHKPKGSPNDIHDSDCIGCPPGFWLNTKSKKSGVCEPNKCVCKKNINDPKNIPNSISASDKIPSDKVSDYCKKNKTVSHCISKQLQPYDIYAIWTGGNKNRAKCVIDGDNSCALCPKGYELTIHTNTGIGKCVEWSDKCTEIDVNGKRKLVSNLGLPLICLLYTSPSPRD